MAPAGPTPAARRATVADLDDKMLWVRILNTAQAASLSPASVQTAGQICRSLITWLMDRGLLDRNPMRGIRYVQGFLWLPSRTRTNRLAEDTSS